MATATLSRSSPGPSFSSTHGKLLSCSRRLLKDAAEAPPLTPFAKETSSCWLASSVLTCRQSLPSIRSRKLLSSTSLCRAKTIWRPSSLRSALSPVTPDLARSSATFSSFGSSAADKSRPIWSSPTWSSSGIVGGIPPRLSRYTALAAMSAEWPSSSPRSAAWSAGQLSAASWNFEAALAWCNAACADWPLRSRFAARSSVRSPSRTSQAQRPAEAGVSAIMAGSTAS
mmetsp:Transcript_117508/g.278994  ORF Transcript_117508/g.278994 Transcript_117508/m.278994 type:complete len:228 (-) Transcript_117508:12-695(-)